MVLYQLLLVGGEELRVFHILQQEATLLRFPVFLLCLVFRGGRAVPSVDDSIQDELHIGFLGLTGGRGWTGDGGRGEHGTRLVGENTCYTAV